MTIKDFAARHKTRLKFDEQGDPIIPAKYGQIYEYDAERFGVMFLTKSVGKWNNRRKECERAGLEITQDGETEGALLFDPENAVQSKTAMRTVGAYRRMALTPEQRAARAETLRNNLSAASPDKKSQKRP